MVTNQSVWRLSLKVYVYRILTGAAWRQSIFPKTLFACVSSSAPGLTWSMLCSQWVPRSSTVWRSWLWVYSTHACWSFTCGETSSSCCLGLPSWLFLSWSVLLSFGFRFCSLSLSSPCVPALSSDSCHTQIFAHLGILIAVKLSRHALWMLTETFLLL